MAEIKSLYPIEITALGGSVNLNVAGHYNYYVIETTGAVVLAGDYTIAPTGVPQDGTEIVIKFLGTIDVSSAKVVIIGRTTLQSEIDNHSEVHCYYDSGLAAWTISVFTPGNASYFGKVYADSTDPIANYLSGKVRYSIEENVASHKIQLLNDQDTPGVHKVYGTNAAGVKGWQNGLDNIYFASLTIVDADILLLNGTPLEIIASPGVGYAIEVLKCYGKTTTWTTPYATNTNLRIITDTASRAQASSTFAITSSTNRIINIANSVVTNAAQTQIIENKGLYVDVETGNPTGGDIYNVLTLGVVYRILSV